MLRVSCYLLPESHFSQQAVAQITAPGTVVRNSAAWNTRSAAPRTTLSNEVQLAVQPLPSRSTITAVALPGIRAERVHGRPDPVSRRRLFRAAGRSVAAGRRHARSARRDPDGRHHDAHAGDPLFVRVVDLDRNRDAAVIETVDVRLTARGTNDTEVVRLSETGLNTGVFVGYIATA